MSLTIPAAAQVLTPGDFGEETWANSTPRRNMKHSKRYAHSKILRKFTSKLFIQNLILDPLPEFSANFRV
jgi:hypothetical protein